MLAMRPDTRYTRGDTPNRHPCPAPTGALMALSDPPATTGVAPTPAKPPTTSAGWASLRELTAAHWFVFVVCCLAWDLDCMDQQLFVLARDPAVADLMHLSGKDPHVTAMGAYATTVFMIGWAIGGIGFGVLGDRLGRVKTLIWTILLYSLFTGLSALSVTVWDFMAYRLLTGFGVGGAFAASVVLLA